MILTQYATLKYKMLELMISFRPNVNVPYSQEYLLEAALISPIVALFYLKKYEIQNENLKKQIENVVSFNMKTGLGYLNFMVKKIVKEIPNEKIPQCRFVDLENRIKENDIKNVFNYYISSGMYPNEKYEKIIFENLNGDTLYHIMTLGWNDNMAKYEYIIAKHARCSLFYACNILKKRFPLGEPAIISDKKNFLIYIQNVIDKNGCEEFEDLIAQDPYCSIEYALKTNKRFKKGEKIMKNFFGVWSIYTKLFL